MKESYLSNYVEIEVKGENPSGFLQLCMRENIGVREIRVIEPDRYRALVHLQDINTIKKIRRGTNYKIRFHKRHGFLFLSKKLSKNKPLLIGLLCSILFFVVLSNMIWSVEVTGVPEEIENKIYDQLENNGVYPGAFGFTVASPNELQQRLLESVPELLWVGIDKKGTSFSLEGVEKLIIEEEEPGAPRHLVADKAGVITSMFVKRGLPNVRVNDVVRQGDLLVSGQIEKLSIEEVEDNEELEKEQAYEYVVAEGEVIATTWYEASVEIPLETEQIEVTGNTEKNYRLKIGSFSFPIWPFKKAVFEEETIERDENQLTIFGWELPLYFIIDERFETTRTERERAKEEAIEIGIHQVKEDLKRRLNPKSEITSEKVLHETTRHGKVNLELYITVEENIAIPQPINQGD
jgi:similar to stage IV sporulation protein